MRLAIVETSTIPIRRGLLPILALSALVSLAACGNPTEPTRCEDVNALNHGTADTCQFSRVAFYGQVPVPFPVTVFIDGNQVGTITGVWPITPPGNCSADFTAQVRLSDGNRHDWNARAANGLAWAGTVQASRSNECILIRTF